jgi:hypothetical protein
MMEFRTGNLLNFSEDLPAGFNHLDLIICPNGSSISIKKPS